jgi:hypothetical protein
MDIIFAVVGIIVINYSVDSLDIYSKLVNPTRHFLPGNDGLFRMYKNSKVARSSIKTDLTN